MSTRSNIAILNKDGSCEKIYCHWDGYPEYNGAILAKYYNKLSKVRELLRYGALSYLDKKISPETKNHSFDTPEKDVCVYYGRDRGEKGVEKKVFPSFDEMHKDFEESWAEYLYVFDEEKNDWFFYDSYENEKQNLKEYLEMYNMEGK